MEEGFRSFLRWIAYKILDYLGEFYDGEEFP